MTHIYDDVKRFALDECINTRPSHIIEAIAAYNMLKVGFLDGVSVSGDIAEWETWWCTKVLPATIHNPEMCMRDTFPPGFTVYTWELPEFANGDMYIAQVWDGAGDIDDSTYYIWNANEGHHYCIEPVFVRALERLAPKYNYYGQDDE